MPKRAAGVILTGLHLDRTLTTALHRQLYEALRLAILTDHLHPGERLPSTRTLAAELGVSRRTVVDAFLQLFAEGYVKGRGGAGTYIARTLPDDLHRPAALRTHRPTERGEAPYLSQRFLAQQEYADPYLTQRQQTRQMGQAFVLGMPALDAFPDALWGRLIARMGRSIEAHSRSRQPLAGHQPLREAVASYLTTARGVCCTADQVLIVSGSQQAFSLIAHVLLDPGDAAWVEEPGYFGAKGALLGAGVRLIPVPVDAEGLDVAAGRQACPTARLAFVTPAHQMPLGVTMSLARRLALLEWAREASAWVVEDDYDSEYRYVSRPLAALQSLDTQGRVIYTGTFSKILFPGLRLGYLVAPPALTDALITARVFMDLYSPLLEQLVLTEFIQAGHFERHIRRMRTVYAERQGVLVDSVQRHLAERLTVSPAEGGMHLIGWLPPKTNDKAAARAAEEHGVRTQPLSRHFLCGTDRGGLLLGYASVPPPEIIQGVRRLAEALYAELPSLIETTIQPTE